MLCIASKVDLASPKRLAKRSGFPHRTIKAAHGWQMFELMIKQIDNRVTLELGNVAREKLLKSKGSRKKKVIASTSHEEDAKPDISVSEEDVKPDITPDSDED